MGAGHDRTTTPKSGDLGDENHPTSSYPTRTRAQKLEAFSWVNKTSLDALLRSKGINRAYLLTQMRTRHCWLSTYAKTFRFQDNDRCVCGDRETVTHILWDCPHLRDSRRELRERIGDAFSSVSSLLGGSQAGRRGKPDNTSRAKTVDAVLNFAEASQRFRSRAPRGQPDNENGN